MVPRSPEPRLERQQPPARRVRRDGRRRARRSPHSADTTRSAREGLAGLEREALRQIHADGVTAEQAFGYLPFVWELLLSAEVAGEASGRPALDALKRDGSPPRSSSRARSACPTDAGPSSATRTTGASCSPMRPARGSTWWATRSPRGSGVRRAERRRSGARAAC